MTLESKFYSVPSSYSNTITIWAIIINILDIESRYQARLISEMGHIKQNNNSINIQTH